MKYPSNDMQHFVFVTKWRKQFFADERVRRQAEGLIRHICAFHGIEVLALGFDSQKPDHVHVMCIVPLGYKMSLPYAAQQIKWFSSRNLRRQFPQLRQDKYFWATHYFQKSVGGGRAAQQKYIENQMSKIS